MLAGVMQSLLTRIVNCLPSFHSSVEGVVSTPSSLLQASIMLRRFVTELPSESVDVFSTSTEVSVTTVEELDEVDESSVGVVSPSEY